MAADASFASGSEALHPAAVPSVGLRIIGGTTVRTNASTGAHPFPAYANLFLRAAGSPWFVFQCGGTVVHAWRRRDEAAASFACPFGASSCGTGSEAAPEPAPARLAGLWVVTAAHCLDARFEFAVNVWTGEGVPPGAPVAHDDAFRGPGENAPGWRLLGPAGVRLYRHPAYDRRSRTPDVALIRVLLPAGVDLPGPLRADGAMAAGAAAGVRWAVVPDMAAPAPPPGAPAEIIGFGKARLNYGATSDTLQRAEAVIEPPGFARAAASVSPEEAAFFRWVVGASVLSRRVLSAPRAGDSGSPLLVADARGRPVVAGVLCCVPRTEDEAELLSSPALYTGLAPFVGPARGAHARSLAGNSAWRRGIPALIEGASPVLMRSDRPSPAELDGRFPAAPEQFSPGNVWVVEQTGGVPWMEFGILALAVTGLGCVAAGLRRVCCRAKRRK